MMDPSQVITAEGREVKQNALVTKRFEVLMSPKSEVRHHGRAADSKPCALLPCSGRRLESPEEPQHRGEQHRGADQRAEHQWQPHGRAQCHAGQLQRDCQLRCPVRGHPERGGPVGEQGQVQQVTALGEKQRGSQGLWGFGGFVLGSFPGLSVNLL